MTDGMSAQLTNAKLLGLATPSAPAEEQPQPIYAGKVVREPSGGMITARGSALKLDRRRQSAVDDDDGNGDEPTAAVDVDSVRG